MSLADLYHDVRLIRIDLAMLHGEVRIDLADLIAQLLAQTALLGQQLLVLQTLSAGLTEVIAELRKSEIVGLEVDLGTPTNRPSPLGLHSVPVSGGFMATIKLVKKSALKFKPKAATASPKPHAAADFVLVDNQDDTCTVHGVDAAGNPVDIAALATLGVTSSDPSIVSVDPPTGMTFAFHAVGPLSTPGTPVNLTITATWNDGSVGPFTFVQPIDVIAGGPTGLQIVLGVPTSRP